MSRYLHSIGTSGPQWAAVFFCLLLPLDGSAASSNRSIELRLEALESRLPDADRLATLERTIKSSGVTSLVDDVNQLQSDIRQLRGEVERLSHDLDAQNQRQQQLYQALDRRLTALEQKGAVAAADPQASAEIAGSATAASATQQSAPVVPESSDSEQADYLAAFEALKKGSFDQAIGGFSKFLQKYPKSGYASNAQYWLGEANYVKQDYPAALQALQTLVSKYPGSAKLPSAQLKIGYIYYETRKYDKAREILEQVRKAYPDNSVSGLATERLERMRKEGV